MFILDIDQFVVTGNDNNHFSVMKLTEMQKRTVSAFIMVLIFPGWFWLLDKTHICMSSKVV